MISKTICKRSPELTNGGFTIEFGLKASLGPNVRVEILPMI